MTLLADALAGVTKIGFDTSPYIYFVERHPSYLDLVREVLHLVDAGTLTAYSSVITLTEVLTQPIRAGNLPLAEEYRKRLINSRNLISKPISPITAELAAEFRAHYRLRRPDALQAATAIKAGCEAFFCDDRELRRITELRVLVLTQQRVMKEQLRRTRSESCAGEDSTKQRRDVELNYYGRLCEDT